MVVFLILVPLAIVTASRTRNWLVRALRNITFGYGMLAGALPDFLLALVLIFIFYTNLELLPGPEGRLGILDTAPPSVTGSMLDRHYGRRRLDHVLVGSLASRDARFHACLRLWRTGVQDVAQPNGDRAGRRVHNLRRSARARAEHNPYPRGTRRGWATIVIVGTVIMFLLGGDVLVESVFNMSGLGQYAVQAIVTADYAPIQAFVCFAAIFTMLVYLAVDLIHFAMDPRIQVVGSST